MATELNTKRIAKNTLLLYVRMFVSMVITFITSRIILNTLGVEDYGTYNIVGSVVVMFSFICSPLTNALQRFINIELGKEDKLGVQSVISTSLFILLVLAVIIIILSEAVGYWLLCNKLNIPSERLDVAKIVFHISLLTFSVSIFRSIFESIILAHERMNAYAYLCIFDAISKLIFVFCLKDANYDKLFFYSAGILFITLINVLAYGLYCKVKFSWICLSCKYFDKQRFKLLLSFSSWTMFGSIVNMGMNSGLDYVLNYFFGVTVNAAVGIKNTVVSAVNGFVGNFQTAFSPQLYQLYGAGKRDKCLDLIYFSSKLSCYLYFVIMFMVFPILPYLLQIWLVQVPNYSVDFIRISFFIYLLSSLNTPLWLLVNATGHIKLYQIIMNTVSVFGLLSVFLLCFMGISPQGVYFTLLGLEIIRTICRLWYVVKRCELPLKSYIQNVYCPVLKVFFPLLVISLFMTPFANKYPFVIIVFVLQILLTLTLVYFVGLNKNERVKCSQLVLKYISKK